MNNLRRMPLKIAGVIGIFSAAFHLAILVGASGASRDPAAIAWVVLMFVGGFLAWIAPDATSHGRRLAMGAAASFFIVGLPASTVFVVIFLGSLVLTIIGFAGIPKAGTSE